jgi:hypothetical protein
VAGGDGVVNFLQAAETTREEVRAKLEAVLAREEFGTRRSWLAETSEKILDRLGEWFGDLFGLGDPAVSRKVVLVLLGLVAAALLGLIVARIARWMRGRGEARTSAPARSLEARRAAGVAALRRDARAAAERGDHLAALRLLFRALVLGLSERGELEYRDAWTNRELFERGAPRHDVAPVLASLVPRLDAQSFGREPAGPADVERLAALCDRMLGGSGP